MKQQVSRDGHTVRFDKNRTPDLYWVDVLLHSKHESLPTLNLISPYWCESGIII